jgi:UDP-N-acetylglucosamine acyltransferase
MMVQAHVGHDATLCDEVIMVNNSALGGHGHIGRKATIGGGSFIHQYCRIGRLAFVTGGIGVPNDVPPFCLCSDRNLLTGVNLVGLRRAGFARDDISHIRDAFRYAFRDHRPIQEMISILREIGEACPAVLEMAEFVDTPNRRAICAGVGRPSRSLAYWLQKMRKGEDLSAVLELEND